MDPASICSACLKHARVRCQGICPCPADQRPVERHIADADCPRGWHQSPPETLLAARDEFGLGDLAETAIKAFGADRLVKCFERLTGRPCRCPDRKEWLNKFSEKLRARLRRRDPSRPPASGSTPA